MPRAKASDDKPRGRMTAYAYFVQQCREEHKRTNPSESVVFADFSRKCAGRWKTMTEREKQPFHDLSEKDKARFDREMEGYGHNFPAGGASGGRATRRRRQRKDPNAPKRALSAFFWFSNDERSKVRAINPDMTVGDVAKELGYRWSNLQPEAKTKYEAMAEKDRARYEVEMTAYKAGGGGIKKAKVEVNHDDDDESDFDDD